MAFSRQMIQCHMEVDATSAVCAL